MPCAKTCIRTTGGAHTINTKDGQVIAESILSIRQYYTKRYKDGGLRYLLSFTPSFYPLIFSLGYYSHTKKEIVICKVLNWKLRLAHERGHVVGHKHTWKLFYVMNPIGILRGKRYSTLDTHLI